MDKYHVGIAAEAIVAALFARCGYEVLVQYGANQPGYDLVAVKNERMLKVSVKGSQDGGWGILAKYKEKNSTFHQAADAWAAAQPSDVVMCFVQFENVALEQLPRVYLARPFEVAEHIKKAWGGDGATSLVENETRVKGPKKGQSNIIPTHWKLTEERVNFV